ncbi:unnamed protein product [Urochloa humidicola]
MGAFAAAVAWTLLLAAALSLQNNQAVDAAGGQGPPVGLSNCPTVCGDVIVPYPFGLTAGCYLPGFNLTCNTSHTPPRLFLGDGTLQVASISLDNATVRVLGPDIPMLDYVWRDYVANGTWGGQAWGLSNEGPYILSEEDNELVLSGCGLSADLGIILGPSIADQVINTCGSVCSSDGGQDCWEQPNSRRCNKCSGLGCCQVPVPIGRVSYRVWLRSYRPPGIVDRESYSVFIAEEGWYQPYKNASKSPSAIPAVMAWAIVSDALSDGAPRDGSATCPKDLGSTTCHSSYSTCRNINRPYSNHNASYTCTCWEGYQGNPYLPDGCQDIDECTIPDKCYGTCTNIPGKYVCECPQGSSGDPHVLNGCIKSHVSHTSVLILGLGVGSGAALLFLVLGMIFLIRKLKERRKKILREKFFKQNRGQLLQQLVCHRADIAERMIVTLEELEKATNNFDKSRELGGGGHGIVYKGILSSLHVVAIKKSKIVIQREIDDFINEVAILSQMNHRNIVKLLGCCLEAEVPLLVYEFISNGTLYNHLHVEVPISISWKDRLRIAVEIARALAYLHSFVSMPVIHRDVKSPNILLNDNLTVKLSDFGASRYVPIDQTGVDTAVQGTFGYLDPMYYNTGRLTEKSDVYSFGVILIELLTRKKPVSYRSPEGYGLVNHFGTLLSEGNIEHIIDPQVSREGGGEVIDISLLAAICVKFVSAERPTMRQVEMTLESIYSAKEDVSSDMSGDEESEENYLHLDDVSILGTNMDTMSQGLPRSSGAGILVGNKMTTTPPVASTAAAPLHYAPSPNYFHSRRLVAARVLRAQQVGCGEVLMHGQRMWSSW